MPPHPPTAQLYNFSLSNRGPRPAHIYAARHVALIIEAHHASPPQHAIPPLPPPVETALLRTLDAIYLQFEYICGWRINQLEQPWQGRCVVQVPLDNAGAGGLAHHGVAGISIGCGLVRPLMKRWHDLIVDQRGVAGESGAWGWVPPEGARRLGDGVPAAARVEHVFFYEWTRNFWRRGMNRKVDWYCDGDARCWGWWTVGMCNAMVVVVPAAVGVGMEYFGRGVGQFRARMVRELVRYRRWAVGKPEPFLAWRLSRLPWEKRESVNDLMTALIVRSYERFGGVEWMRGVWREWWGVPDVNEGEAGGERFQDARDNVYRIWSRAAAADLRRVFEHELWWPISDAAKAEIARQFPAECTLTLALEEIDA